MFLLCSWDKEIGPAGGMRYWGIAAPEIQAVCHMQRVPVAKRPLVLEGVKLMASHGASLLNEQTRQKEEEISSLRKRRTK